MFAETIAEKEALIVKAMAEASELRAENAKLRVALAEIAKGEGRYSPDRLEHASNTIEDMKELARKALED